MAKQLDADLKNAPDEAGSTELLDRDADERDRVRRTGWEPERGVFFRLQRADRAYAESCDYDFGERRTGDFYGSTRSEEELHDSNSRWEYLQQKRPAKKSQVEISR